MEAPGVKPSTKSGEAWVKGYLHPPTEEGEVDGIPDHSTQSSLVVKFRNEFTITAPPGTIPTTWSAALISLPNPRHPLLVMRWAGDLPPALLAPGTEMYVVENPNFNWGSEATNWNVTAARFRPTKFSSTVYFDTASLYNQGKVWCSKTAVDQYVNKTLTIAGSTDKVTVQTDLGLIPVDGSAMMQLSAKYYSGLAKDGCYSPCHFVNPTVNYQNAATTGQSLRFRYNNSSGGVTVVDFDLTTSLLPAGQELDVPVYPDLACSYMLFKGMLPQATLSDKIIHSWECVPDAGSSWGPFATPGPCPDGAAMELAAVEMYKMADGFPSAANDLAAFWNAAKSLGPVASTLWKGAKPLLKTGLSTLPAGGLLNQIVDSVEKLAMARTPGPSKGKGKGKTPAQVTTSQPRRKARPTKSQKKRNRAKTERDMARMEELD